MKRGKLHGGNTGATHLIIDEEMFFKSRYSLDMNDSARKIVSSKKYADMRDGKDVF